MDEIYLVYKIGADGRRLIGEFFTVLSASAEIEKQVQQDREQGQNNGYEIERKVLKSVERSIRMKKIDWSSKLTSRKFWAAIASFVSMLIIALGGADTTATQVTALIMAGASVIAYVIGEGLIDAAGAGKDSTTTFVSGLNWHEGEDEPETHPPEDAEVDDGK